MAKYIIEFEDEPMVAKTFFQEVDELWKAKGFKKRERRQYRKEMDDEVPN